MSEKARVIVTRKLPDLVETRLMELFDTHLNLDDTPMTRDELTAAVQSCDILVPTVTDNIDAAVIAEAGPDLKLMANFGVGVNHIDLKAAEAQRKTFRELLAATQGLYESTGSVSREELSRAELEFNSADAEYNRLLISEQREKVEYQLAEASLAQRSLKAPFNGTVVEVAQDEGEISEAYEPIVQIVDVSQGFLVCNVEEATGRDLLTGDELSFEIPKGSETLSGQALVEYVSPVVDSASGLLKVRLRFDNEAGQIRPGVPGYVTLPEQRVTMTGG